MTNISPDYFAKPNAEDAVVHRIKGNFRREFVFMCLANGESVPRPWLEHGLSEPLKEVLTADAGPQGRGGEDLPDLWAGEVEIARLSLLNSVHGEVTSLRAKRNKEDSTISLSMVDEYGTEFALPLTKVDRPLSAKEVLVLFRDAEPSPTQTSCRIGFQSYFYPELESLAVDMGLLAESEE
jgi:hypothetical protein